MTAPTLRHPPWRRRGIVLAGAAVIGAAIIAVAVLARPQPGTVAAAGDNREAPAFAVGGLRDPDHTVRLTEHRGRPVVLNFWASWCAPCRREMSALQAVHEQLREEVVFLGINHQDDRTAALDLLDETGVTYRSGFDPEGRIAAGYGLFGMPTTVFITADGTIAARHTGEISATELRRAIDRHLSEP